MNKVYKTIWNESIGAWIAVGEDAAARGKSSKSRVGLNPCAAVLAGTLVVGLFTAAPPAQAYTYGPGGTSCTSTPAGVGPDGINRVAVGNPVDGSGN